MPQGSALGPLLFLLYINDLHNTIKFSSPFHFADDTCILKKQNSVDEIDKPLTKDLKELSFWLNTNKIALNATKTEVIVSKNKIKTNLSKLNLKLCRKKLHLIESARYLGVIVDENFNCKKHFNDISHKLVRGNAILSKIRNYVNKGTLRTVYFAIFHSDINYVPIAWGNTNYPQQRISLLQKKALRIMHFVQFNSHTSSLFYNSNILKFIDIIYIGNCVFINNCFNKDSFAVFAQNYNLCSNTHTYNTRSSSKGFLFVPTYNLTRFGRKSIIHSSTLSLNYLQSIIHEYDFLNCSAKCLKNLLTKYLISKYDKQ